MKIPEIQPQHIHCAGCVHLGDYDEKTECMNLHHWEGGTPENAPCYETAQCASVFDISSQVKKFVADCSRSIRELEAQDARLHDSEKRLLRTAKKLSTRGGSFAIARAKALTERTERINALRQKVLMQIDEYARRVMSEAPVIDAMTSFNDRCDLLSISAADREHLTERDGIVQIVLVRKLVPDGSIIR